MVNQYTKSDFGYIETHLHGTQLFAKSQRTEFSSRPDKVGARNGRTRSSGLLRAWHLGYLFGIVDALRPVVIEWLELHGW